ncbi:hypothetical protein VCUG_00471 [Vavraia culicis subsp. floridensis]|uniref:Uncharacterized protein n=1 Tax=Vavraia culicis (isolate floridensis) TaxID=948595 RepID=L2GXM5_VAVCU|nr:uncharacterized protein VCUG_00471 [Vavraia culicis subsp. floridensis]ELA48048.1 hypothetical protein VCUG_00471 [Vavraia culicis subsp. floridensis]
MISFVYVVLCGEQAEESNVIESIPSDYDKVKLQEFKDLINGFEVLESIYFEEKQPLKQDIYDENVVKKLEYYIGKFCRGTGEIIAFVDSLWNRLKCDITIKEQIKCALAQYTEHRSKLVNEKLEEYDLQNHASETRAQQQYPLLKTHFVPLKVATSALEGDLIIINYFVPLLFNLGTKQRKQTKNGNRLRKAHH